MEYYTKVIYLPSQKFYLNFCKSMPQSINTPIKVTVDIVVLANFEFSLYSNPSIYYKILYPDVNRLVNLENLQMLVTIAKYNRGIKTIEIWLDCYHLDEDQYQHSNTVEMLIDSIVLHRALARKLVTMGLRHSAYNSIIMNEELSYKKCHYRLISTFSTLESNILGDVQINMELKVPDEYLPFELGGPYKGPSVKKSSQCHVISVYRYTNQKFTHVI